MEKEKRDKEMKAEVDRQHYFAESGGKIRSKAEAREGGSSRRSVRKIRAAEQAASTQEQARKKR